MPREVELKSVVDDVQARRRRLESAGATLLFEGRLDDRRYDTIDRRLARSDEVLRFRVAQDDTRSRALLEWKGPTRHEGGYKVRDEIATDLADGAAMTAILEKLGYAVATEIDRDVAQYAVGDAVVRFERYPQMDTLVEVEGTPEAIERAITALGMDRAGFTTDRLAAFMERFERRTGTTAIVSRSQRARAAAEQETRGG